MRTVIPAITVILSLSAIACSRTPGTGFQELQLEHRADRLTAEEEAREIYALGLHMYSARDDEPAGDSNDRAEAWLELIAVRGALEDMEGAEIAHRVVMEMFPGAPLLESAHLELAEAALAAADDRLARMAVDAILNGAYGYAHETRLVQNLATLLALKGDREGARAYYERIREMTLYAEIPLRFRSLEIFRDYLDSVGQEFPHFSGTAFGGEEFDTRSFRGRPLFIHFWRRLGSLNHDIEFLEKRRLDYPDLAVVSINVGDPPEAVRQAVLKHAPEWPMYHDPEGKLAESLGITFMGLYVHEPKGILLDGDGRFAVLPGREGAIDIGLRTLQGPPHAVTPEVTARVNPAGESVREREDLYLLLELAAALSVLNDVDGAREAYEKVIEITGGAGETIWCSYIEALNRVGRDRDLAPLPD